MVRARLAPLFYLTSLFTLQVTPISAQAAASTPCDDLILTDSLLLPQAQRLADYRNNNITDEVEMACVVTMGELAEMYPEVQKPQQRIRHAIQARLADSRIPFRFLTLFGDASFTPGSPYDHVPTLGFWQNLSGEKKEEVSFDGAYGIFLNCDSCLGMLSDTLVQHSEFETIRRSEENVEPIYGKRNTPSFAIGRIPAHTLEQAQAYVNKVMGYEALHDIGPGLQTYAIVADDDRHGQYPEPITNMPGLQNEVWNNLAIKPLVRRVASIEYDLTADSTLPQATEKVLELWNSDLQFLMYFGHGAPDKWSNESLFDLARDSSKLAPKTHQPIVLPVACSTAPFAIDSSISMGEAMLFSSRGAIAWVGGTGETYPGPNNQFVASWLAHPPQGAIALGTLILQGIQRLELYPSSTLDPWTLLGDPALMVRFPNQPLTLSVMSNRAALVLPLPSGLYDSLYIEVVRIDTVLPDMILRQQPLQQEQFFYERETVIYSESKAVEPGMDDFTLSLSDTLNPMKYAVKAFVWNSTQSSYGYFPLWDLPAHTLTLRDARRERLNSRSRRATTFGIPKTSGELGTNPGWLGSAAQGWVRTIQGRKVPLHQR